MNETPHDSKLPHKKPVTMRLSGSEWIKLAIAIGAQLIGVTLYVQSIDHKAETARATATEARAEVRELRDKTESKLERIDAKIDTANEKINTVNNGVTRIEATLERRVP